MAPPEVDRGTPKKLFRMVALTLLVSVFVLPGAFGETYCHHCTSAKDCRNNYGKRHIQCLLPEAMCATWTLREKSHTIQGNVDEPIRMNCFYEGTGDNEGCERGGVLERCICKGSLCNVDYMPDRMKKRGKENEMKIAMGLDNAIASEVVSEPIPPPPPDGSPPAPGGHSPPDGPHSPGGPTEEHTTTAPLVGTTAKPGKPGKTGKPAKPTKEPKSKKTKKPKKRPTPPAQQKPVKLNPNKRISCYHCNNATACRAGSILKPCQTDYASCGTWSWEAAKGGEAIGAKQGDVTKRDCFTGFSDGDECKVAGRFKVCICQNTECNAPPPA